MKLDNKNLFNIILICLLAFSIYNIFILSKLPFWSYPLNYNEPVITTTSLNLLYKNFTSYPYVITYYTPMFYVLRDTLAMLIRVSQPYLYERLLSIIATICDAVVLYFITKKLTRPKSRFAILAPLLFISAFLVLSWSATSGPTMFELLFDLIGVYLLIGYESRKSLVLSAAALAAAFFFRQTGAIMFVVLAIYLLMEKGRRDAATFAGSYLLMVVPIVLLINALTSGRFLFSIFLLPSFAPLSIANSVSIVQDLIYGAWIPFIMVFAVYWLSKKGRNVAVPAVLASVVYLATTAKFGSSAYYLIVFFALSCIAACAGLDQLARKRSRLEKDLLTMGYLIMIAMILINFVLTINSAYVYPFKPPTVGNITEVSNVLSTLKGPILSENPEVPVASNKTVLFEPSTFWTMQDKGLWSDSNIVSSIASRNFSAIVMPDCIARLQYYPQILSAVSQHYHLQYTISDWYVFYPDNSPLPHPSSSGIINQCTGQPV